VSPVDDRGSLFPVPKLRRIEPSDHANVLALNEANVEALAPMDEARLLELDKLADRFDVIDVDGRFGGFVITFAPGSAYDSENYRWFAERHDRDFYYLDRIVLADEHRRRGLGSFVYDELEQVARPYGRLALEVNLVPRNDVSLAFHDRRGYVEVGRLGDEAHRVSLMEKRFS
jgi:predicted GNAT superfamily acetyltransferase